MFSYFFSNWKSLFAKNDQIQTQTTDNPISTNHQKNDQIKPHTTDNPISINHLKELRSDVEVTPNEIQNAYKVIHEFFEGPEMVPANKVIHEFFEGVAIPAVKGGPDIVPMVQTLYFNIAVFLAKLNKFRIQKPFYISEINERMIAYAKGGVFQEAFKILNEFPAIVNYIPPNRAWGLLHQAAFFNDYKAVKQILDNPKCDPFLRTKQTRDGVIEPGSTAFEIAKDATVKELIKQHEEDKTKSLKAKTKPTLASIIDEKAIEVESILLTLNCFENVLHPKTLNSMHSLTYSNLMLDIFEFINLESNWVRARQKVALQLQSLDMYAAIFLATGDVEGDIMYLVPETKSQFYSRVIHLYSKECKIGMRYGGTSDNILFYKALNISLCVHGHGSNPSFVSGEDLALAAYGILLNSILMYWTNLKPTNEPTYRGMNLPPEVIAQYKDKKGKSFTWLCFTSTSLSEGTAKSFLRNCSPCSPCMFICDNTQCTKYAAKGIRAHSDCGSEEEYLYPSGAKFHITSVEETNGITTFRIRLENYVVLVSPTHDVPSTNYIM